VSFVGSDPRGSMGAEYVRDFHGFSWLAGNGPTRNGSGFWTACGPGSQTWRLSASSTGWQSSAVHTQRGSSMVSTQTINRLSLRIDPIGVELQGQYLFHGQQSVAVYVNHTGAHSRRAPVG
jgi:hypothetical protein